MDERLIHEPDHRFIVRRVTFSILPDKCDANLFVKASESANLWSGLRSVAELGGVGRAEYAPGSVLSNGLCAGALSRFFGNWDNGGECKTSDYEKTKASLENEIWES